MNVLWDSQARARPSYIGEGNILKRLVAEHAARFALPRDGYAAPLDGSAQRAKADAEIVEALLLRKTLTGGRALTWRLGSSMGLMQSFGHMGRSD
jgi:hypothetical protein